VEIKCQLNATEVFIADLLLAQHVSGTTMPIIRSSRVIYSGCCLWYFVLWFSSCWSGVELRVMCPICRMLQHPANWTHNPQLRTRPVIRSAIKTSVASSWHFISTHQTITTFWTSLFLDVVKKTPYKTIFL